MGAEKKRGIKEGGRAVKDDVSYIEKGVKKGRTNSRRFAEQRAYGGEGKCKAGN